MTIKIRYTFSGLCLGDSGGPLFKTFQTEDNSRMSVLIGIVSRGTGSRGNCGGLDNATHYVRIKKFLDWILVIDIELNHEIFGNRTRIFLNGYISHLITEIFEIVGKYFIIFIFSFT